MKNILYSISKKYYETLCEKLRTRNEDKIISYLNTSKSLKCKISELNIE